MAEKPGKYPMGDAVREAYKAGEDDETRAAGPDGPAGESHRKVQEWGLCNLLQLGGEWENQLSLSLLDAVFRHHEKAKS